MRVLKDELDLAMVLEEFDTRLNGEFSAFLVAMRWELQPAGDTFTPEDVRSILDEWHNILPHHADEVAEHVADGLDLRPVTREKLLTHARDRAAAEVEAFDAAEQLSTTNARKAGRRAYGGRYELPMWQRLHRGLVAHELLEAVEIEKLKLEAGGKKRCTDAARVIVARRLWPRTIRRGIERDVDPKEVRLEDLALAKRLAMRLKEWKPYFELYSYEIERLE